jgi:hydrogenase expression/formation protein HypC
LEINTPAVASLGGDVACGRAGEPIFEPGAVSVICLAIPGQIMEVVDEANRLAKVDVAGVQRNINIGLLDGGGTGAVPGDWVLIHVGFAMSKIDEREARATLGMLQRMGADYEQELEELKASVID